MIDGLNAEETYKVEEELNREACIMVNGQIVGKVDQNQVRGTADDIIKAVVWGNKQNPH